MTYRIQNLPLEWEGDFPNCKSTSDILDFPSTGQRFISLVPVEDIQESTSDFKGEVWLPMDLIEKLKDVNAIDEIIEEYITSWQSWHLEYASFLHELQEEKEKVMMHSESARNKLMRIQSQLLKFKEDTLNIIAKAGEKSNSAKADFIAELNAFKTKILEAEIARFQLNILPPKLNVRFKRFGVIVTKSVKDHRGKLLHFKNAIDLSWTTLRAKSNELMKALYKHRDEVSKFTKAMRSGGKIFLSKAFSAAQAIDIGIDLRAYYKAKTEEERASALDKLLLSSAALVPGLVVAGVTASVGVTTASVVVAGAAVTIAVGVVYLVAEDYLLTEIRETSVGENFDSVVQNAAKGARKAINVLRDTDYQQLFKNTLKSIELEGKDIKNILDNYQADLINMVGPA
ncbi:hypothetical protein [Salinimonas chungwhensis]|uniref:hypothetical protein n=1 Tax=Salinimonas chungwhensis TaxID=265425 RepID=UPI00037D6576|nr:hypothetical protein [Salinimonas chungwhensis]